MTVQPSTSGDHHHRLMKKELGLTLDLEASPSKRTRVAEASPRRQLVVADPSMAPCTEPAAAGSSVRTVFKDTGGMPADTLDTPLFSKLTEVLLKSFPKDKFGPSLELFSHKTIRTDVCNMFDPTGTVPGANPDDMKSPTDARCFHNPFMKEGEDGPGSRRGYVDFREAVDGEYPPAAHPDQHPFGVTLIDPPYTPMEQKKLYSNQNKVRFTREVAADLMLTSQGDIDELYRLSVEWAIERTKEVIVIYGYKNPTLPGWERRVIMMSGAGSGHPTVWAVVYTRSEAPATATQRLVDKIVIAAKSLNKIVRAAKSDGVWDGECQIVPCDNECKAFARSLVGAEALDADDAFRDKRGALVAVGHSLREQQGEAHRNLVATIYGKQDQYTRVKKSIGATLAPAQHPSYLSGFQAALHSALFKEQSLALVSRQWTLYKEVCIFTQRACRGVGRTLCCGESSCNTDAPPPPAGIQKDPCQAPVLVRRQSLQDPTIPV